MLKQDQVQMKKQNKKIVLDTIRSLEPISRIQLAKVTKMSPTTITRIVQELVEEDFIFEAMTEETTVGRRPTLINLKSDARYTIGVEIDRSIIRIGLLDFICELVDFIEVERSIRESYEVTLEILVKEINNLIVRNNVQSNKLLGIGVGVPGFINHSKGIILVSEQMKWENKSLKQDLQKYFDCLIMVDNELKMQIIAENDGLYSPKNQNCILIGIGSGIGASILLNGEIYRGVQNNAGEIGHMTVNPFGEVCECGNRGCLSRYTTESTLLSLIPIEEKAQYNTLAHIVQGVNEKKAWALHIVDHVMTYLAIAINNLVCVYEPECVIVSGEVFERNKVFQDELLKKCETYVSQTRLPHLTLRFSTLHSSGVVKGAAMQVQKVQMEI
ncbi:ROK family transcriptional regulator [Bacillus ndiopicus]|uniref:ROK family transcriptional regulator n=1 Tax=Bacillus ndiopicus TaxID=1347368 RepID=UPI0005A72771|nr:ROK family transcriptional regulator [Bacillus ndiopicus]